MVRRGQHAVFMCNGLFTSNRSLEQLYEWELDFFENPIGDPKGGDYRVDTDRKAVEIGAPGDVPVMRAVFREGIGCVILPPDQDLDDIFFLNKSNFCLKEQELLVHELKTFYDFKSNYSFRANLRIKSKITVLALINQNILLK